MRWCELSKRCRLFLCVIYFLGIVTSIQCLRAAATFDFIWILLLVASFFIAAINLRLPHNPSVVVSMGDVFTLVVLLHFGPAASLLTYWANIIGASAAYTSWNGIKYHRLFFNLAACSLSVSAMSFIYSRLA